MTWDELVNKALIVYDEYHPQQATDEDLKTMVSEFMQAHINDFLCVLPTSVIKDDFKVLLTSENKITLYQIDYNGGRIELESLTSKFGKFLKLLTFKHAEWSTKLFYNDLIDENSAKRKLQGDKWTSGKTSNPVICIENVQGKRSLCFWGYNDTLDNIEEFSYIKKIDNKEDFLKNEDYILQIYIYYVLYYIMTTTQELEMAQQVFAQMQQLLSLYNIDAVLPPNFNTENKK